MFKVQDNKLAEKYLDKMIVSASRLKKLTQDQNAGWAEFVRLLDDYTNALLEHKKNFDLTQCTDEQFDILRLHDRDIWLIKNFIRNVPMQFCNNLEDAIRQQNEEKDLDS